MLVEHVLSSSTHEENKRTSKSKKKKHNLRMYNPSQGFFYFLFFIFRAICLKE